MAPNMITRWNLHLLRRARPIHRRICTSAFLLTGNLSTGEGQKGMWKGFFARRLKWRLQQCPAQHSDLLAPDLIDYSWISSSHRAAIYRVILFFYFVYKISVRPDIPCILLHSLFIPIHTPALWYSPRQRAPLPREAQQQCNDMRFGVRTRDDIMPYS